MVWDGGDGGTMANDDAASKRSAEEIADPFEQPYWNLDQYLIWLASRDPAAVLSATDRPNSGTNPPSGWYVHRQSNVDHQKVETEAVRAIKDGDIKTYIESNGKWFTLDDPEWLADWTIEFEGEPTFATLLMRAPLYIRPQFTPQSISGDAPRSPGRVQLMDHVRSGVALAERLQIGLDQPYRGHLASGSRL